MRAKRFFTNADHLLSTNEVFDCRPVPNAKTLYMSEKAHRGFYGFGVAITPSSCYELTMMEPEERHKLLTHLYTNEGVGLTVARLCIGSSDYSPEIYSYDEVAGDTELAHFSVERDEEYVIPIIQEILEINPRLYIFASPWSPPYWMKTGGNMCGGYMRDEFIDCYAEYFIKYIEAYAAHGIKISAVTPQNELEATHKGRMPACAWHPLTEAQFIKTLRAKLDARGLDVRIWMCDQAFDLNDRNIWMLENYEGLRGSADGVAYHYYTNAIEETRSLKEKFPELELHFTEGGPRLKDNYDTDWCKWGIMISRALDCGYSSFTGWNLMLDELGGPNVGPFLGTCAGLVTRDSRSGELSYSGQYKAFRHIVPYITPESDVYTLSHGDSFGQCVGDYPKQVLRLEGFVIDNRDGKKIAVVINPNARSIQSQIVVDGRNFYIEMYGNSISTIIIEQ